MDPSGPWKLGWTLGGVVVVIAAGLLLAIIGLAQRIIRQAGEIEDTLDRARENTTALFDITSVNLALDRAVRSLRAARGET